MTDKDNYSYMTCRKLQTNKIITFTVNMPPERVHSSKRVVETMKSHQVTHRMK